MKRFLPFATAAMLAMSSTIALAQTSSPPTTEAGKSPSATEPGPAATAPPKDPAAPLAPSPVAAPVETAPSMTPSATTPADAAIKDVAKEEATLTQSPGDIAMSKLVGASVYNQHNEHIGEVEDIIISSSGAVSTVVIGVGGFLGIGEKKVAMPFAALRAEKGDNNVIKIVVEQTRESLKALPNFKYVSSS